MIGEATGSGAGGKDDSPAAVSAKKNKKPNCMKNPSFFSFL